MWTQRRTHRETPRDVKSEAAPGRGPPKSWGKASTGALRHRGWTSGSRTGGSTLLSLKARSLWFLLRAALGKSTEAETNTPTQAGDAPGVQLANRSCVGCFTNDSHSPSFYFAFPLPVHSERKAVHRWGQNAAALFKIKQTPPPSVSPAPGCGLTRADFTSGTQGAHVPASMSCFLLLQ